jgi:hypothetical protein
MTIHVPLVTSGSDGFLTCFRSLTLASTFRLQLRKDFQPVALPRLAQFSRVAGMPLGLLVSIIAFIEQIGEYYATKPGFGQFVRPNLRA